MVFVAFFSNVCVLLLTTSVYKRLVRIGYCGRNKVHCTWIIIMIFRSTHTEHLLKKKPVRLSFLITGRAARARLKRNRVKKVPRCVRYIYASVCVCIIIHFDGLLEFFNRARNNWILYELCTGKSAN